MASMARLRGHAAMAKVDEPHSISARLSEPACWPRIANGPPMQLNEVAFEVADTLRFTGKHPQEINLGKVDSSLGWCSE
jgi:hypothetical protein